VAGVSPVMPFSAAAISDFNILLHLDYHCYNSSSEIIRNDKHVRYTLTLSSWWIFLGQNSTIHSAEFFLHFASFSGQWQVCFCCVFSPKEFTYHPCIRYVNTVMLFLSPVYHMALP